MWLVFITFSLLRFIIIPTIVVVLGRPILVVGLGSLIVPGAVVPVALIPGVEVVSDVAIFRPVVRHSAPASVIFSAFFIV